MLKSLSKKEEEEKFMQIFQQWIRSCFIKYRRKQVSFYIYFIFKNISNCLFISHLSRGVWLNCLLIDNNCYDWCSDTFMSPENFNYSNAFNMHHIFKKLNKENKNRNLIYIIILHVKMKINLKVFFLFCKTFFVFFFFLDNLSWKKKNANI